MVVTTPERTEHGWLITGKTHTERQLQVRKVPVRLSRPLAELRAIQRNKVCSGCGGKISLRTYNNFDCQPDLLFSRNQYPVCLNEHCSQGIEWGVPLMDFKKALSYVKKNDFGRHGREEAFKGYGKSRRYNYYYLSMNVRELLDLWYSLNKHFGATK